MSKIDVYNDNTYVQPDFWNYMKALEKAASNDIVLVATPATLGSSAAAVTAAIGGADAKFTRTVNLELQTAAGAVHTWFNGKLAVAVAENTAGDGVSALAGGITEAQFTEGKASVTIEYTGAWTTADTQTLTVTGGNLFGKAVTNKTSVDTLVA